MNETYKLPFTASEIEEKLEKAGEKGLEQIAIIQFINMGEYGFDEYPYGPSMGAWTLYTMLGNGTVKVIIGRIQGGGGEARFITWGTGDNANFGYDVDLGGITPGNWKIKNNIFNGYTIADIEFVLYG